MREKLNCAIIGTGKIGIDVYIKCKKSRLFENIYIYNKNSKSEFKKTPVSNIESKYIWQNLGFSKKGEKRDVIDAHPEINFSGEYHRLYISKLRRNIKLDLL
jgi:accessory colonization factor AcfC